MSEILSQKLRSDAQDNRDLILAAARELFAERGLDVGMREVARRAGVGPATLYRRFPTRQALIDDAFAHELRACEGIVEDGCADPDAWQGFAAVVERLTLLNIQNRGFVDAFMVEERPADTFVSHRRRLLGMLAQLARRAQVQGGLRDDFVIDDLVLVLLAGRGLTAIGTARRERSARRFAQLALDAFHRSGEQRPA